MNAFYIIQGKFVLIPKGLDSPDTILYVTYSVAVSKTVYIFHRKLYVTCVTVVIDLQVTFQWVLRLPLKIRDTCLSKYKITGLITSRGLSGMVVHRIRNTYKVSVNKLILILGK